ncbi:MAG: type III pantothenate kinase [Bacteroidales bacterium]
MNLCIDIGNSMIKTAVFSGYVILEKNKWHDIGIKDINKIKSVYPDIENVILCSVRPDNPDLIRNLRTNFPFLLVMESETDIPLESLYETGNTLGKDRVAAVTGANNNYPGRNVLVIDAGTAITFDMVDESNRYIGGNISPGISLRFRALHDFTGKLPLAVPKPVKHMLAKNTEDSIVAGVMLGILFEIETYIDRMKKQFSNMIIILTGGDAKYFDKKLKRPIFVDPDLIFTGLNRILIHNAEKK